MERLAHLAFQMLVIGHRGVQHAGVLATQCIQRIAEHVAALAVEQLKDAAADDDDADGRMVEDA